MSEKPIKPGKGIMWHIKNDPNYKPGAFTEESIRKVLEETLDNIPERKFVIYTGCRTRGGVMIGPDSGFIPCGDELCTTCVSFHNAMKEAANNLYPYDKEK